MYWKTLLGRSSYASSVSWCRQHPKQCLSLVSAGYMTLEGTKGICDPMPPEYRDYASVGVMSFGLCAATFSRVPLFLPGFVVATEVMDRLNDLLERRKQYLLKQTEIMSKEPPTKQG